MDADTFSRRRFIELLGGSSAGTLLATTYGPAALQAAPAAGFHQVQPSSAEPAHPWRVEVEEIGVYDVARLNHILTIELAEFAPYQITYAPAKYPVKLYRILYPSVIPELNNRPTTASGLLAVPDMGDDLPLALPPATLPALPVLSYQHGSVFGKDEVPSSLENSTETRLMVAIFASQGYLLIGADYFGRGQSSEPNSYIVKASTEQACLDMLFAGQAVAAELGVAGAPRNVFVKPRRSPFGSLWARARRGSRHRWRDGGRWGDRWSGHRRAPPTARRTRGAARSVRSP